MWLQIEIKGENMIRKIRTICEIGIPFILVGLLVLNYNKLLDVEVSLFTSLIAVVIFLWVEITSLTHTRVNKLKVRYHGSNMCKIEKIKQGDWVDLRTANTTEIKKGEFKLIPLGISVQLPRGYEAHIVPRSSTYKNYKVIQTNGIGIIDESYNGDDDQWMMPVYALEDTVIPFNERVCQFRVVKKMDEIEFVTVDKLNNSNRGGFGSTGK